MSPTGLVQQFVERTGRLYSLPAVAVEVLRLTSEPRIDAKALKTAIERDPALTTRLLRVVNSSLFGVSRQVSDLNQALALLGIRPLKMLVLGFSLPKELFAGLEADLLAGYWRRTLIKAVAARELSERFWKTAGDEAFTAGLVQDIGMLALIQQLGESYHRFLNHVQAQGGSLIDRELESLGFDHVILSSRLLSHWGLPGSLCAAVAVAPDEGRIGQLPAGERTLPQILHLAELLARLVEQPYGSALRDLLDIGGRYCGLTYDKLQPVVAVLQEKVEDLAEVLNLALPDGRSYVDLLIASQGQLADETALTVQMAGPSAEDELLALAVNLRSELETACGGTTRVGSEGSGFRVQEAGGRGQEPARDHSQPPTPDPRLPTPAPRPPTPDPRLPTPDPRLPVPAAAVADDPGLPGRVAAAVQRCRQFRCPVTLALVEIDNFSDLLARCGPARTSELTRALRFALAEWTSQRTAAVLVSDSCLALVWEDCARNEAVRLMRQAIASSRPWLREQSRANVETTLSAGLATIECPPRNFPPQELIAAAQRCLHGAQLSGGGTAKSIEL